MTIGRPIHGLGSNGILPAVNLVALITAVALLWWRTAALEQQVQGLGAAVHALEVEVAQLTQALHDRP